jgi:MoaA/NifB/PqqE/SkfB family radical SAM enzyme
MPRKPGLARRMPNGYITILPNEDVIPCMLLQVKLGNVREQASPGSGKIR